MRCSVLGWCTIMKLFPERPLTFIALPCHLFIQDKYFTWSMVWVHISYERDDPHCGTQQGHMLLLKCHEVVVAVQLSTANTENTVKATEQLGPWLPSLERCVLNIEAAAGTRRARNG